MKFILLVLSITAVACVPTEQNRPQRLMDEIERSVILPSGALPISRYARYYAEQDGKVYGAYTTITERRLPDYGCSEMTGNFDLKDVDCPSIADAKPGSRRWVKFSDYPAVDGANCSSLHIIYDLKTGAVDDIRCAEVNR